MDKLCNWCRGINLPAPRHASCCDSDTQEIGVRTVEVDSHQICIYFIYFVSISFMLIDNFSIIFIIILILYLSSLFQQSLFLSKSINSSFSSSVKNEFKILGHYILREFSPIREGTDFLSSTMCFFCWGRIT